MCNFLKLLAEDGNVHFEKCGDVVISTKDNFVALFCHFCRDIFTRLPEFLRHLQAVHADELQFTQPQNVYSVEELLADANEETDIQSEANSSGSGDSGLPTETEAVTRNKAALAASDAEFDKAKANKYEVICEWQEEATSKTATEVQKRDVLAEVQAMLFEDEQNLAPQFTTDADVVREIHPEELEKDKAIPVNLMDAWLQACQQNPRQSPNDVQDNNLTLCETVLDIKPVSNVQRTKHNPKPKNTVYKVMDQTPIVEQQQHTTHKTETRTQSSQVKEQSTAPSINNICVTSTPMPLITKTTVKNNCNADQLAKRRLRELPIEKRNAAQDMLKSRTTCDLKSLTIQRSARRRQLQQRLGHIKKRIIRTLENDAKPTRMPFKNASKVLIQSVEMLPSIKMKIAANENGITQMQLAKTVEAKQQQIATTKNLDTTKTKLTTNQTNDTIEKPSFNTANPQSIKMAIERNKMSPNAIQPRKSSTDPNSSYFGLSDSTFEFLQHDLKSSQLDADSLFSLAERTNDDLLNQVRLEQLKTQAIQKENAAKSVTTLVRSTKFIAPNVYMESHTLHSIEDLRDDDTLLKLVGLPIINNPDYENQLPLDEFEALRQHADKFAKMLVNCDTIWNPKYSTSNITDLLKYDVAKLTQAINKTFGITLSVGELKRIVNLINMWYGRLIDQQFCNKVPLSDANEYYVRLFNYMPKIRRRFLCELCLECFGTVTKYTKHQEQHSGTSFSCPHCAKNFKRRGYMEHHLKQKHGEKETTNKLCQSIE